MNRIATQAAVVALAAASNMDAPLGRGRGGAWGYGMSEQEKQRRAAEYESRRDRLTTKAEAKREKRAARRRALAADDNAITIRMEGEGTLFRCDCRCNVFHHPANRPDVYECNACRAWYVSDTSPDKPNGASPEHGPVPNNETLISDTAMSVSDGPRRER